MKNRYWYDITTYMNNDIREQVRVEITPLHQKGVPGPVPRT